MAAMLRCPCLVLAMALLPLARAALDTSAADRWDPFVVSDAENAYIIETYGGVELINYAKEANLTVVASNTLFKSLRNTPFIELLYPNGTATANGTFYDVWNSELVMSQLNSNQNETLDYSSAPPAVFNFDKKLMMDMNIYVQHTQSDLGTKPLYREFPFRSNDKIAVTYEYLAPLRAAVFPPGVSPPYQADYPSSVYRWNTYLFYPSTRVYMLVYRDPSSDETRIYAMQAFNNDFNNQYTPDQLVLNPVPSSMKTNPLTPSIKPPANWTFAYIDLDRMLIVHAKGEALVINDNLFNAYMYIEPDAATQWLYAKYSNEAMAAPGPTTATDADMAVAAAATTSDSTIIRAFSAAAVTATFAALL